MNAKKQKEFEVLIYNKRLFVSIMALEIVIRLMAIGSAMLFGNLVSLVADGKTFMEILPAVLFTLGYTVVYAGLRWVSDYARSYFCSKGVYHIRNSYIKKLFATKYSLLTKEDSSRYINNLTADSNKVLHNYALNIVYFVASAVSVVGSFAAAVYLNWIIAVSMLGFTVILAILPVFIKKPYDRSVLNVSRKEKEYLRSLKENLLGITVIKNNLGAEVCQNEITGKNANLLKANKKSIVINSIANGLSMAIRDIATVALIVITCYMVYLGRVKIGAVLSVFSIGSAFYGGLIACTGTFTAFTGMKSLRRAVLEILGYPSADYGEKVAFEDAVELKNVSFNYPGAERPILKGVSARFQKNKKYLIIGKSGSGKSTILKLLCKFYEDYEGEITLDKKPYASYSEKQINGLVAYSQQDCYLFNRSLRENIDFLKSDNPERLNNIINAAQLKGFVDVLPEGVETVIDEEVNQVSGGEKLRISLARSLFRESGILLLDEVTGALDKKTSETVEKTLLDIKDKTLINVCHKFNDKTLPLYDRIFIIENGKIVCEGTYEELKDDVKLRAYRNNPEECLPPFNV